MSPSPTIDRSIHEPEIETTAPGQRVARMAAERASSLRGWAASMRRDSLAPLTTALHRRAGELELIAAVLSDAGAPQDTVSRSIA